MLPPYIDTLEPDRSDESLTLDADDAIAEVIAAYVALRSPYDGVQEIMRAAFYAEQSEDAQEAIDRWRAGNRAVVLAAVEDLRRPQATAMENVA